MTYLPSSFGQIAFEVVDAIELVATVDVRFFD